MKKIIALILALILTFSLSPLAFATDRTQERDVWDLISEIERRGERKSGSSSVEELTAVYNGMIEEIIDTVISSSTYVPGSLERHGNFFFWMDTNGDPNGYSPNLRAKLRVGAIPGADPADYAATEIVNYNTKGGNPSSVDVAAFQPYIGIDSSFTAQYENRCNAIAQATGGVGTTYKTNDANINNLGLALSTCGVVIFDSHGTTDYSGWSGDYTSQANSSYLCLTTSSGITDQDKQSAQGEFGTYYHAFNSGGTWCVDGTAMSNHMTSDAPNSMVWMAICLGMATDGMEAPFRAHGVDVVYGYSQSVTFTGDYKYDGYFWPYMCQDHTVAESCAYMKQMAGCNWDPAYSYYSYSQAVSNYVAFPIVASSEDPYPGHGHVDVVQVPESEWTLFPQFAITAVSNQEDWGTVAVNGRRITATPVYGYTVIGYEVLAGDCQVTQNGNVFVVDAQSDCTIQINFAPRDPAVVNFVVPDGVSCESFEGYVGDVFELPEPTGEPTANAYHYRFLGWVSEPLTEDSMEMPDFLKAGTNYTVTNPENTFYALYKYFVAEDGVTEGQFTLVNKAPASWSGEYVITYDGTKILDATGTVTGVELAKAVHDLSEIGGTKEGDILYNIPDDYIFTVDPAGSGAYTVKMKEHEVWLSLNSDSNNLMTADNGDANTAKWLFSFDGGVQIASAEYPARTIRYNTKSSSFRCYKTGQQQISLYSAGAGTTWFTTTPRNVVECEEHVYGEWTTVKAPTCTESGSRKHSCTVCGHTEYEVVDPLGHDYVAGEPVAPNCLDKGYTPYTCSRCQDSYNDDFVDALGHDYQAVVTEPNCTEGGYTTHTCSRCSDSYTDSETAALGHDFGEWTVTAAPKCTEPGEETRTCSRCDAFETQPVDALGHDFGEWTVTSEPSCTEPGEETRTCSRCDAFETRPVDVVDHTPGEPVKENENPATCTETGDYDLVRYCSVCGKELSREHVEVSAVGHTPAEPARENEVPATCTAAGAYDLVTRCSVCGEILNSEHVALEALDHAWDDGVVSLEPTETTVGTMLYTCTRCGATREEEIPVLEHDCKIAHFADVMEAYPYGTPEHEAIEWAYTNKYASGMNKTSFGVGKTLTRAQTATFLYAAAGKPEFDVDHAPKTFSDVPAGKWYTKPVLWAAAEGIVGGYSNGTFKPNSNLTRGQILVILYAEAGKPEITVENPYTDVPSGKWYTKAALWAYQAGIERGENGKFAQSTPCTRDAFVLYLYRFMTGNCLLGDSVAE